MDIRIEDLAKTDLSSVTVVDGKRIAPTSPGEILRPCRFFGLTDGWWLRLQRDYDARRARATMTKQLGKV